MANRISAILDLDGRGFKSSLASIKTSIGQADTLTGKFKAGFSGLMAEFKKSPQAQAAVAGGLVAIGAASVQAASNLAESTNAVNVAFGKTSDSVLALGDDSATAFGLSERAFNEFAVQFSAFANQIAKSSGQKVSTVVEDMTTRVADFASVMNMDVPEAAQIFQSALAGETEPIRKFGIDLSAAAVAAHAVETGIADSASEMTEAQKVQARYSLLMQSTNKVAGDFANTSDGLANSQRIVTAQIEDLSAKLGGFLIPQVAAAASSVSDFITVVEDLGTTLDRIPGFEKLTGPLAELANYPGTMLELITLQLKPISKAADLAGDAVGALGDKLGFGGDEAGAAAGKLNIFEKAVADATDTENMFVQTLEDVTEAARAEGTATDVSAQSHDVAAKMLERHTEALEVHGLAVGRASDAEEEYIGFLLDRKYAGEQAAEAALAQAEADEAAAEAAREHRERIDELYSSLMTLVGGDIAVREANRQVSQSLEKYAEGAGNAEVSAEELAAMQDDAASAMLRSAQAATDNEVAMREAGGESVTMADKTQVMRDKLANLASILEPGSPLRRQIEGYIGDLDAIPSDVNTAVHADVDADSLAAAEAALEQLRRERVATVRVRMAGGRVTNNGTVDFSGGGGSAETAGAAGGIINRPTVLLAGEAGPEALVPLHRSPGNGPLPQSIGGGSNFYLTVNAGVKADGPEIARLVMDAVKKYERANGTGWRR